MYTGRGDGGYTCLSDERNVIKDDQRIRCIGKIDQLTAQIGHCKVNDPSRSEFLDSLQRDLMDLMSDLSSLPNSDKHYLTKTFEDFEVIIDDLSKDLPPLKQFILPGYSQLETDYHICRVLTREAEREIVKLRGLCYEDSQKYFNIIICREKLGAMVPYLNRLSSLFFVLARCSIIQNGGVEKLRHDSSPIKNVDKNSIIILGMTIFYVVILFVLLDYSK